MTNTFTHNLTTTLLIGLMALMSVGVLPVAVQAATPTTETATPTTQPDQPAATTNTTTAQGGDAINCSGGVESVACGTLSAVLQPLVGLGYLWFTVMNFLLWLVGLAFNYVLVATVFNFAANFGNSEGLLTAWSILRDVGNIFLLFSFVFMGLATILNIQSYAMKKALPRLLIFAVLLNFSLFAAEAMVDVTNGLSAAISMQSTAQESCAASPGQTAQQAFQKCATEYGVSGGIMKATGLSTSFNYAPEFELLKAFDLNHTLKTLMTLTGLTLFSTILCVVFVAALIMLLIRVVVLTFIMVTAPIGFAGLAVPLMEGLAKKWWKQLINQSLFVPVFLLLVFIGLKVMDGSAIGINGQNNSITDAFASGQISYFGIIITFMVVCGFMIAALIVSKQMGAAGADFAIKMGARVGAGTLAAVTRRTLGYPFAVAQNAVRNAGFLPYEMRRNLSLIPGAVAGQSFDMVRPLLNKAGLDAGGPSDAAKKGITGIMESISDRQIAYGEVIDKQEAAKQNALHMQKEDLEKQKRRMEAGGEDRRNTTRYRQVVRELEKVDVALANTSTGQQNSLKAQLEASTALAHESAQALEAAKKNLEGMRKAFADAKPEEMREAQANLTRATQELEHREEEYRDRKNVVDEQQDALSEIRDRYARELESARRFWGPGNYVADASYARSRDKLLKYGRDPGARERDEIHHLLHSLEHTLHGGGGHAPAAAAHAPAAAAHAPTESGGHDDHGGHH